MSNLSLSPLVLFVTLSLLGGCEGRGLRIEAVPDQQVYVNEFLRVPFEVRGTEGRA